MCLCVYDSMFSPSTESKHERNDYLTTKPYEGQTRTHPYALTHRYITYS